ncbi:MAG: hypothetical protein JWN44_2213 [Myxococcales bacterium]|nr:hypothetical protein [Myxococcales bacterium]
MNTRLLAPLLLVAACGRPPDLALAIRLPDDRRLLAAVAKINMTATRDGVVLASSSNSASASTVSLSGVSPGARTVISLDGVDATGILIARGKTCPVAFGASGTTAPLYFAPTNFFAPTAAMPTTTRSGAVALALDDGTVLVAGGADDAGLALATTDLFTPGSAVFAASSPALNHARAGAQAVALSAVGVLVVGGVDTSNVVVADAELYSETQRAFLPISDPRLDGRVGHRLVALPDGSALVSGGSGGDAAPAPLAGTLILEVRSDGTARVSQGPTMIDARREHAATVAIGILMVFGGYGANGEPLDSIEAVDPAGSAARAGRLQYARAEATASLLPDGSILIVGGVGTDRLPLENAELYNPITRSTTIYPMAANRRGHTATVLTDGRVLVAGGITADKKTGTSAKTTSVELFGGSSVGFLTERSLGTARAGHAAVSLCDETVLVVGGNAGAEIYSQPAN